jgi:hypothetical protein
VEALQPLIELFKDKIMEDQQKLAIATNFIRFASDSLNLEELPKVFFINDNKWSRQMRSFGQYNPQTKEILVYIKNRNMADILRTLCHEMVHHKQNEEGRLKPDSGNTGSDIENEANAQAGILLREYGQHNEVIYEGFNKEFDHYFGLTPKEYILENGKKSFIEAVSKAKLAYIEIK